MCMHKHMHMHKSLCQCGFHRGGGKSSLASGNRQGEHFFITYLPAYSNVYQNIQQQQQQQQQQQKINKKHTHKEKIKRTKENRETTTTTTTTKNGIGKKNVVVTTISVENLTGYSDIVWADNWLWVLLTYMINQQRKNSLILKNSKEIFLHICLRYVQNQNQDMLMQ